MITKPTLIETDIWANTQIEGEHIVVPSDDYIGTGWIFGTKPPYTYANWMQKNTDSMLVHLNQNGLVEWDTDTSYNDKAFTKHGSDYYIAKQANTGSEPTAEKFPITNTDVNWSLDIPMIEENLVVNGIGISDADKVVMTDATGKIHPTLIPIGTLVYRGGVDITLTAPLHNDPVDPGNPDISEEIESGDFWSIINDPSAVYDVSFDPLNGNGYEGEGIIAKVTKADPAIPITQADVEWYRIGAGVNDNYLIRDGSLPMTGTLVSTVSTGTSPFTIASTTLVTNLNSDLLDSQTGAWYVDWPNFTSIPTPTYTLTGDVNGVSSATLVGNNVSWTIEVTDATNNFTVGADDVTDNITTLYGTTTIGSVGNPWDFTTYGNTETATLSVNGIDIVEVIEDTLGGKIAGGTFIDSSYDDPSGITTISHSNTSDQVSVTGLTNTVFTGITLDSVGHITNIDTSSLIGANVVVDASANYTGTDLQTALNSTALKAVNLINGTQDITFTSTSGLTSVTVRTALDEIHTTAVNNGWPEEHDFVADGVQDTFSPAGGYVIGEVAVYASGIKMRNIEYTASNGVDVVLNNVPDVDTWIQVVTAVG